ncbi:MAG: DUF2945 domain-containing protein [Candidatus Binataceae bacterium]
MPQEFKRGDHVSWNSEAGRVRGVIVKKVTTETLFKDYMHHASKDEPQYIIKSETTGHVAIHKGHALKRVTAPAIRRSRTQTQRGRQAPTSLKLDS